MGEKETFEQSIKRLEQIVTDLERGDLPLEEALSRYEEGVGRLKRCYGMLEEVEKKIVLLTKDSEGSLQEMSFDAIKQRGMDNKPSR